MLVGFGQRFITPVKEKFESMASLNNIAFKAKQAHA